MNPNRKTGPRTVGRALAAGVLALAWLAAPATAAPPPSDAAIEQLLDVMKARESLGLAASQAESMVRGGMQSTPGVTALTPAQHAVMERAVARVTALLKEEMDWPVLKPLLMSLYRDHFDAAEIDGMIAFYRTPVGRAVVDRTPQVTQQVGAWQLQRMQTLQPKLQRLAEEMQAEMKALESQGAR